MNTGGWASGNELERVHEIVEGEPLPPDFRHIEVSFGLDQNNVPAVWLIFWLAQDRAPTTATYEAARSFAHAIQPKLLNAGIERWPYTRVKPFSAAHAL